MEQDGCLIGQNMFMKTVIEADDGRVIPALTMGPTCITPELKRKGYGKKLLDYSLEKAAELGFGAVLFEDTGEDKEYVLNAKYGLKSARISAETHTCSI